LENGDASESEIRLAALAARRRDAMTESSPSTASEQRIGDRVSIALTSTRDRGEFSNSLSTERPRALASADVRVDIRDAAKEYRQR
jgi:hypothetical protein